MGVRIVAACIMVCMAVFNADAAGKGKASSQIDAARGMIEGIAAKVGGNKAAAADLEQARALLRKAEESLEKGRALFGFGDLKPEAEQEVKHYTEMTELAVSLAASRIERSRAETELEGLDKQLAAVKAKVKLFEDRKAELEKLRKDAAKCQTAAKELETIKAEKAQLASQVEQLLAERGQADKLKGEQGEMTRKLEELKAENSRLKEQVERFQAERKALPAQPAEAGTAVPKPATVDPPPPVKEKPAEASPLPDAKDATGTGDAAPAMPMEKK